MTNNVKELLKNSISKIFYDIKDIQAILDAVETELNTIEYLNKKVRTDAFIKTATIDRIKDYERILGIINESNDNIETRRAFILSIFTNELPFTLPKLKESLNTIAGFNNWTIEVIPEEYKMVIEIIENTKGLIEEIANTFYQFIPAHIFWQVIKKVIEEVDGTFYLQGYNTQKLTYEINETDNAKDRTDLPPEPEEPEPEQPEEPDTDNKEPDTEQPDVEQPDTDNKDNTDGNN